MSVATRRWTRTLLVAALAIAACSTPALAHAGHESHEGSGLSIWPFLLVFGAVTTGGSVLAARRFDVSSEHALGLAIGGAAMAIVAAVVWFL